MRDWEKMLQKSFNLTLIVGHCIDFYIWGQWCPLKADWIQLKSIFIHFLSLEFTLHENGRVNWANPIILCSTDKNSPDHGNPSDKASSKNHPLTDKCLTDHPLTDCNAYEVVVGKKSSGRPETSLHRMRFAAVKGQVISFEVSLQLDRGLFDWMAARQV